ncbi:MAG: amidohydrolase [Lachnospiraceae bacterium]|nr:amidohydrolase [Lachnospiraceae bacterium]
MSDFVMIDAHVHLWEKQDGCVNNLPVQGLGNGKSTFIGGVHQMMPPYMEDNRNTAERLIANMDYACVNACAVTQEYLDGNQDEYLLKVKEKYPDRFKITALYEDEGYIEDRKRIGSGNLSSNKVYERTGPGMVRSLEKFDGVKICACRLKNNDLMAHIDVFKKAEAAGKYISIDMADGDEQVESLQKVINECPNLRIAIGHFGMVTTLGWQKQIELAKNKNVYIESGGLTWLFHKEFYPYPSAIDAILEAKSICGIDKLMWGSDYPRTMTDITYKSAVRFILESNKLTDEDKAKFLGENAIKFYGFKGLKPMPEIDNML